MIQENYLILRANIKVSSFKAVKKVLEFIGTYFFTKIQKLRKKDRFFNKAPNIFIL